MGPDHAHAARVRFTKMHGAGNDFVVLDLRHGAAPPTPELCRALADRRMGVGCDQILTVEAPRTSDAAAAYGIRNADGSASGQCGNGARCVAAWLVRESGQGPGGGALGERFVLDSPAGAHAVDTLGHGHFRIAMGAPMFAPAAVPLAGFASEQDRYAVEIAGSVVYFGAVSMGNPHAVIDIGDLGLVDIEDVPVAAIGAALQAHPAFPESANIGFAQLVAPDRIRLRVYERGVGETLACGSGACAAAAVLMRRGRLAREAVVSLPGGDLQIARADNDATMLMSGPTTFVFDGEWLG
jgi:diaminopimelate epimerase